MAKQRGFFSWWFGELREVFSGRAVPVYALALSAHEVALIEKGVDTPLGVVDTQADDWLERIEGLRSRILRRNGRNPLVEVQLPAEQVMFAKVKLGSTKNPRETASSMIKDLTGQEAEQVTFDLANKIDANGSTVIAIAPATTVAEAARYATDWGFEPARVTSIEAPSAFRRGPDFEHGGVKTAGSKLPKIAAALAVLAIILTGAAAIRALQHRAVLTDEAQAGARSIIAEDTTISESELALAEFAHAAAAATDLRDVSMPVWRLLAEVASIIPSDVVLTGFQYRAGQIILRGTTASTVSLEEALDRSPIFNAPTLSSTGRSGSGRAEFEIEATVDERSIR